MNDEDVRIRKVRVLNDRAKELANEQGLSEDDLVIIRTTVPPSSLPEYTLEKIEGSPSLYLQNKIRKDSELSH